MIDIIRESDCTFKLMNPVRGSETSVSPVTDYKRVDTFKLMNPVRGIETLEVIGCIPADLTFKLMNPVRGIETLPQH